MAKRTGRPRKAGKRTKGNRPVSAPKIWDRGNAKAELRASLYGTDASDALGRAYRSGLLGEDGQRLLMTGRAVARAYWPQFGIGQQRCTLNQSRSGGNGDGNIERERWLVATLDRVTAMSREHRRAFDQLVIDPFPDEGPDWLDRLIAKRARAGDDVQLSRAMAALTELAA